MYNFTHMLDSIHDSKEAEICAKNIAMLADLYDKASGETIRFPYSSLLNKYRDFLSSAEELTKLSNGELILYQFQPKRLSSKLYGTTELWADLLQINGMISILEFKRPIIRIYNPAKLNDLLNEILIMEGKIS